MTGAPQEDRAVVLKNLDVLPLWPWGSADVRPEGASETRKGAVTMQLRSLGVICRAGGHPKTVNKMGIIWTEVRREARCSHRMEVRVEAPAVVLEKLSGGLNEG